MGGRSLVIALAGACVAFASIQCVGGDPAISSGGDPPDASTPDSTPTEEEGPACPAGRTACGGTCVDTADDPKHCGRCDRDCGPTTCTGGRCGTIDLATGQQSLTTLTVVSNRVVWAIEGSGSTAQIRACPKPDCAGGVQLLSTAISPNSLAADETEIYWTQFDTDSIRRCSTASCTSGTTLVSGSSVLGPSSIVLGPSSVAWLSLEPGVNYCLRTSCTKLRLDDDPVAPSGLATDGNAAYWIDGTDIRTCAMLGCGGQPSIFSDGVDVWSRIAAGGGIVYWTTGPTDAANVRACAAGSDVCPDAGTAMSGLSLQIPVRIAADASGVYVAVASGGGSILTCPATGCTGSPAVVVEGQGTIRAIALDQERVWFATEDGVIRSIRK